MVRAIKLDQKTACVSLSHRPQLDCTHLSWLRSLHVVAGVCDWPRGGRQRRLRGRDVRQYTEPAGTVVSPWTALPLVEVNRLKPSNAENRAIKAICNVCLARDAKLVFLT